MEPCPADRTKRSRSGQCGFVGACFRWFVHRTYAIGAAPIGRPGWPEFAFCTASAARNRMVLTASFSSSDCPIDSLTARPARVDTAQIRFYGAGRPSGKGARLELALVGHCAYWNPRCMASVDSQLESGERVLFRTGSHPLAFSGAATMALFVALVVALLILHNELPPATQLRIALSGLLVALVGAIPSALRWRNTALAVTDRRILTTAGSLRRRDLA